MRHGFQDVLNARPDYVLRDYEITSLDKRGKESFTINPLDRIAQLVVVPVLQVAFNVVDDFDASQRGAGGFGSTGAA